MKSLSTTPVSHAGTLLPRDFGLRVGLFGVRSQYRNTLRNISVTGTPPMTAKLNPIAHDHVSPFTSEPPKVPTTRLYTPRSRTASAARGPSLRPSCHRMSPYVSHYDNTTTPTTYATRPRPQTIKALVCPVSRLAQKTKYPGAIRQFTPSRNDRRNASTVM